MQMRATRAAPAGLKPLSRRTVIRRNSTTRTAIHSILVVLVALFLGGCATIKEVFQTGVVKLDSSGNAGVDFAAVRQMNRIDCGAACLAAVLKHWDCACTEQDIVAALKRPEDNGYTLDALQSFAKSKGFDAYLFSGSLADLRKHTALDRPCIVVYRVSANANHAVVVIRVDDQVSAQPKLIVMDPARGEMLAMDESWLAPRWGALGSPLLLIGAAAKGGDPKL